MLKEYSLEVFKDRHNHHQEILPGPEPIHMEIHFHTEVHLPSISDLEEEHYAKQYVRARRIPAHMHRYLFFAKDFKAFVESLGIEREGLHDNDHRLVIPFFDEEKRLVMVQGRALGESKLRYIAISIIPGFKFFGMDRVNRDERVYVLEGPIDAMMIPNAIATGDSDLTRVGILGLKDTVLVYDNEPRNKEIIRQMEEAIDMGFRICIWPEKVTEKDINEMVIKHFFVDTVVKTIDNNTHEGLRAKLELTKWRKI